MERTRFSIIFLAFLLLAMVCAHAQFTYFGLNMQIVGAPAGGSQFVPSVDWMKQVSAHHGFGAEIGLPIFIKSNPGAIYEDVATTDFDAQLLWKRSSLPYLGARYRLFVDNSFFIGTSLQVGLVRERFYADRQYDYREAYMDEISAVYLDYRINSPFVKWNFETGFIANLGDLLYFTLQGRLGIQSTKPPVVTFGRFSTGYGSVTAFKPYQGTNVIGGALMGLGVKL
jgi:hypothetical protein